MTNGNPAAFRGVTLLLALAVIAVLTIAAPYAAVTWLHARRLDAADLELDTLAARIPLARLDRSVTVLAGPGETPRAEDPRWTDGTSAPILFQPLISADPWGNAYVVNTGAATQSAIWVLSAGPNGIIETPFEQANATSPAGDDRAVRLR